jgi:hypothetical protein
MSVTTRLCVFGMIVVASLVAWQWNMAVDASRDATRLAVQQFQNSDAVAANLQQASLVQNWWGLVWPTALVLIAMVMFWDDGAALLKKKDEASA